MPEAAGHSPSDATRGGTPGRKRTRGGPARHARLWVGIGAALGLFGARPMATYQRGIPTGRSGSSPITRRTPWYTSSRLSERFYG